MIRTTINAGACGFHTTVIARSDDMQMVSLEIASDCEKIRGLAEALKNPIDAYQEIGEVSDGTVLKAAAARLKGCCAGCAVPSGLFKSVQVAGGGALSSCGERIVEVALHGLNRSSTLKGQERGCPVYSCPFWSKGANHL